MQYTVIMCFMFIVSINYTISCDRLRNTNAIAMKLKQQIMWLQYISIAQLSTDDGSRHLYTSMHQFRFTYKLHLSSFECNTFFIQIIKGFEVGWSTPREKCKVSVDPSDTTCRDLRFTECRLTSTSIRVYIICHK